MTKFTLGALPPTDTTKPVLYKVGFSDKYYLHKSKTLKEGVERFLDDVFRGMRGKSCPESYSEVVKYCLKYPAIHKVSIEVILNSEPDKILRKEAALYKSMRLDQKSLNRLDLEPYKPEWMIKQALGKRCDNGACMKSGIIGTKKQLFKFCPNCGRLNK